MDKNELNILFKNFINLITKIGFIKDDTHKLRIPKYDYKDFFIQIDYHSEDGIVTDYGVYFFYNDTCIEFFAMTQYNEMEIFLKGLFPHPFRKDKIDKLLDN